MPRYRYKQTSLNTDTLQRRISDPLSVNDIGIKTIVDITVNASSKEDLDEEMLKRGFIFDGADPVDSPDSAIAHIFLAQNLDGYALDTNLQGLDQTVSSHYNQLSEAIGTILADLDGYALKSIEDQRWADSSQQRQDIRDVLDGYGSISELQGIVNTELEHTIQSSEIFNTILKDLDGYALKSTEDQRWSDSSQQRQDIRDALDGYDGNSQELESQVTDIQLSLDGYASDQTVSEHYTQHSEVIQTILGDLDGYALLAVENQRWSDSSQQRQDIRDALDGYDGNSQELEDQVTDIQDSLDGYASDQTVLEHYSQHSEVIQTILAELDGYHPDLTGQEHYRQHSEALQTIIKDLDGYALKSDEDQRWIDSSQQRQDIRDTLDGYSDLGTIEICTFDNVVGPSTAPVAWSGAANNITLSDLGPADLVDRSEITELTNPEYDNISAEDGYVATVSSSIDGYGEYFVFKCSSELNPIAVNEISIEVVSRLESTIATVVETFDSAAGWTSSDITNTVPSLNTTIHQEGTGCLQINTTGSSDGDRVYKTYSPIDLSSNTTLMWEERIDFEGSELEYYIELEDSLGNSKKTPKIVPIVDDQWRTISVDLMNFSENQGTATDESDIVKITVLFGHASSNEIFYIDHLRTAVSRRQQLSIWDNVDSDWLTLVTGINSAPTFEDLYGKITSFTYRYLDAYGDIYYRLRSLDSVSGSTDDLKVDFVKMSVDSRAGSSTQIIVQEEGVTLTNAVKRFNFVGAGVVASEDTADEITITISGGVEEAEFVSSDTFQENKAGQSEINNDILKSLDGYAVLSIENQRWSDSSQQRQDIRDALDGYTGADPGLSQTVQEHYTQHSQAINTILEDLDGYAPLAVENQRWSDSSQQLQDIRIAIDGYGSVSDLQGVISTELEHTMETSETFQTILKDLDGYALQADLLGVENTETEHYRQHSVAILAIRKDLDGYADSILALQDETNAQANAIQIVRKDLDGYALLSTEDQRWANSSEQLQGLRDAADGYRLQIDGLDQTVSEHYAQHGDAIQTIISALDGYEEAAELGGLAQTVQEHYIQHSEAINTVLKDLDGYALLTVEDQRWSDSSQQLQDIRIAIDGYGSTADLQSIVSTELEHTIEASETFQTILKDLDGYALLETENQRWTDASQQLQALRDAADGYTGADPGLTQTVQEHYTQHSQAIQTILGSLDGYSSDTSLAATVEEHKNQFGEAIQTIRGDLDGYALLSVENQRWVDSSQQLQDIRVALDGYSGSDPGLNQTVQEHYTQHSEAIQTILKDLDGYSTSEADLSGIQQTVDEHYRQHSDAIQTILKDLDGYSGGGDPGLAQTVDEHYRQHSQAIHDIVESLDGYSGVGSGIVYAQNITVWTPDSGLYRADVTHNIGTSDTFVEGYSISTNKTVGFEDIERINNSTLRLWVATEEDIRIMVAGAPTLNTYFATISAWTPDGSEYYGDVTHNLGSNDIMVQLYLPTGGKTVGAEEIERIDSNTVRVRSATNTDNIRVMIFKII